MADRVLVIAEAGVNHDGDRDKAVALIDAAAAAGADVVKFQTFRAGALATAQADKAAYQKRTTDAGESQQEMLRRLELSHEDHDILIARAREKDIEFLSTPFDRESLDLLLARHVPRLKLGSGDLTNAPLLLAIAQSGRPLILSTGMATLAEVENALAVLAYGYGASTDPPGCSAFAGAWRDPARRAQLRSKVTLLHCTTEYPCPTEDVNLRAMATLAMAFGLPVGYSDHTDGVEVAIAAVALGAAIIEKHLTLDRSAPGPDHAASLEPDSFSTMVHMIRTVERALGDGIKRPAPSEVKNMAIARKSLVAGRPIAAGTVIGPEDIACKRPGGGRSPMEFWIVVGTVTSADIAEDDKL